MVTAKIVHRPIEYLSDPMYPVGHTSGRLVVRHCHARSFTSDSASFRGNDQNRRLLTPERPASGRDWMRERPATARHRRSLRRFRLWLQLNDLALKKNVSRISPLYCYDIHQRHSRFQASFDLLLLFDVLEHIEDESGFLQSARFHLADSGTLLVNVPAHEFFHSDYDRAAGHIRRYSAKQLQTVLQRNGFRIKACTYWGLPLVPLLLARKALPLSDADGKSGFDPKGSTINGLLRLLSQMEPIPQSILGTSVMAVAEKAGFGSE